MSPPERPADMERSDEVGAAAAAEYFLELFSYVMHTGDLEEWDSVSAQDCGFCGRVKDDVAGLYSSGGTITGGDLSHSPAQVLGQDPVLGGFTIQLDYEMTSGQRLSASGEVQGDVDADNQTAYVDVIFTIEGWKFVELSLVRTDAVFRP